MIHELTPLSEYFKRDSSYWGDCRDWLVVLTQHRDSGSIEASNFRVAAKLLHATDGTSVTATTESANHWAVGWVEYLLVRPDYQPDIDLALKIVNKIDIYSVLDDDDQYNLAYERKEDWIEVAGVEGPADFNPWDNLYDWEDWIKEANKNNENSSLEEDQSPEYDPTYDGQLSLKGAPS